MHLSFSILIKRELAGAWSLKSPDDRSIDEHIFYSVPGSAFVLDTRMPSVLRDLIVEAEGCLKMNYLTGASACARKAIYELLVLKKVEGTDYQSKIKSLASKCPDVDPVAIEILCHIQDMTCDKVHEQSWEQWNSDFLRLILGALRAALHDIYVVPADKEQRRKQIEQLRHKLTTDKKVSA